MKTLVLLLMTFLLSACATTPEPLKDHSEQGEIGFRFVPPKGEDWFIHKPPGFSGFAYAKKVPDLEPRDPKHSVIFAAQYGFIEFKAKNPDDMLKLVKEEKERQARGARFELKRESNVPIIFKGTKCLKTDSLAYDRKAKQNMTLAGVFCLHPQDYSRYIDISYSQRYDLDRQPLAIDKEGEAFVEGLKIQKLKKL